MGMGFKIFPMETHIRVTMHMENLMEMVNTVGLMELLTKDNLSLVSEKEKEPGSVKMGISLLVILVEIGKTGKVSIIGQTGISTKAIFAKI